MLVRFFRSEPAAAIVLLFAAVLALIVANSPLSSTYEDILGTYVLGISDHHWINDALMAVFFLLAGMELKQEALDGALSTPRARILPGIAAIGGMALPAIIFVIINLSSPDHLSGWAHDAAPTPRAARLLPGVAAIGGTGHHPIHFVISNLSEPEHLPGWVIPTDSDIAFARGVLAIPGT